ncbi:hypothetical protein Trydic_g18482 [Trypoxylus dichotomus]
MFWDVQNVIMVDFFELECTINALQYVTTLKKLQTKVMVDVLHLHGNARPPTGNHTTEEIVKIEWEILPHPSYRPDLAPSAFHFFDALQEAHNGLRSRTVFFLPHWDTYPC